MVTRLLSVWAAQCVDNLCKTAQFKNLLSYLFRLLVVISSPLITLYSDAHVCLLIFVSPAKHSDTKGSLCPSSVRPSVCPSVTLFCHTFHSYVSQAAHAFLGMLPLFFSSPEPKARVSYCHSAPSVVRPSVVVVCP